MYFGEHLLAPIYRYCDIVYKSKSLYLTPLHKYVLASSHKVSSIKTRLKLCRNILSFSNQLILLHDLYGVLQIIELVCHLGLGGRCPLGTLLEVLLDEGTVSSVLKEPRAPCHRCFNDLVTDNKEDVPAIIECN